MYQGTLVSLNSLIDQKITREKSIKALRSRAQEGVLVFKGLDDDGRTRLYDKNLSVVRVLAARACKNENPRVTWGVLQNIFSDLDSYNHSLNQKIIRMLNDDNSMIACVSEVKELLIENLKAHGLL